eukprot:scaffold48663_cov12-Prasinocladus_malaysianus.AAC.1
MFKWFCDSKRELECLEYDLRHAPEYYDDHDLREIADEACRAVLLLCVWSALLTPFLRFNQAAADMDLSSICSVRCLAERILDERLSE